MCETRAALPPGIEPISADEARRLIRLTSGPEFEALLDRASAIRHAGTRRSARRPPGLLDDLLVQRVPPVAGGALAQPFR